MEGNRIDLQVAHEPGDSLASGHTLHRLNPEHLQQLLNILTNINRGLELEQVLELLYTSAQDILPCDRLALALVDRAKNTTTSAWVKSNRPIRLAVGYSASLEGSSLNDIIKTGKVRIINDLEQYYREHPDSIHTRLILEEGLRSSMTCPLYARDGPLGFLFFTSEKVNAYADVEQLFYQHVAAQVSIVIERARLYTALSEYTAAIEKQSQNIRRNLELARQLQQTFIPEKPPDLPGLDMAMLYEPLEQVGGDLLELLPMPDGRLFIFIADAMGHGVPAALSMAVVKATFHAVIRDTPPDPSLVLQNLNEALPPLLQSQFAAGLAMLIDPNQSRVRTARAGLVAPILISGKTGEAHEIEAGGLPLSVDTAEPYEATELAFEPGDMIILATDGMTEASNSDGEQYGSEGLVKSASRCAYASAAQCLQTIVDDQVSFRGGRPTADDITVLIVKRVET